MCVQTPPGHFLGADQPQASGFPTRDLSLSVCRMEVMARPPCWGVGRAAVDTGWGEGHVSCRFQLRPRGHELVFECIPRLGSAW